MRVLSVISSLSVKNGGPPEVLKNHLEVINKQKKIISVFRTDNITLYFLVKCLLNIKLKKKFKKFLKKYDLIHFHEIWSLKNIIIIYFARKLLCKYLFVGHGHFDQWSLRQSSIKKKIFINVFLKSALKSASAIFFSNIEELEDAKKNFRLKNVFIIPNGINISRFKNLNKNLIHRKKIVFFGRIHKKKGIEILLEAITKLPETYFEKYFFEICGPGEKKYVSFIKQIIKKNDFKNKLQFKDFVDRDNKIKYLSEASIFVLPSYEEGDSIALKEALAMSIPVIISSQCRMSIVEKTNSGIVFELNAQNLYNALIKISHNDIELMGKNARKLIENKFDNIDCSERVLHIYQDIMCGTKTSKDWMYER